jgi:eukaryotic-like serine/threonine-protein kinase
MSARPRGNAVDFLLDAPIDELHEWHQEIRRNPAAYEPALWAAFNAPGESQEGQRLRAASALASINLKSPKWKSGAVRTVAVDLVESPAIHLAAWMKHLAPLKELLVGACGVIYREKWRKPTQRTHAIQVLATFAAECHALGTSTKYKDILIDFMLDADIGDFDDLLKKVQTAILEKKRPLTRKECNHENSTAKPVNDFVKTNRGRFHRYHDRRAKRHANAAIAMAASGDPAELLEQLAYDPKNPSTRSHIIHRLPASKIGVKRIAEWMASTDNLSVQTALLLTLGSLENLADAQKDQFQETLAKSLLSHDSGLHAASEWVLRRWGRLDAVREKLGAFLAARTQTAIAAFLPKLKRPTWYLDEYGHTMVVIPPCEYLLGSPKTERGRQEDDPRKIAIPYHFAISAHPVTWTQFMKFKTFAKLKASEGYESKSVQKTLTTYKADAEDPKDEVGHFGDRPANFIEWHKAAEYCDWLNRRGLGRSFRLERSYVKDEKTGKKSKIRKTYMADDYLKASRYRLPTEQEMEWATRAASETARFFGNCDELLEHYAWYGPNADNSTHPVGTIKPNEFGLFDVQGNVSEWCEDWPLKEDDGEAVLRGGMFFDQWSDVRSAYGYRRGQNSIMNFTGFRIARTILTKA